MPFLSAHSPTKSYFSRISMEFLQLDNEIWNLDEFSLGSSEPSSFSPSSNSNNSISEGASSPETSISLEDPNLAMNSPNSPVDFQTSNFGAENNFPDLLQIPDPVPIQSQVPPPPPQFSPAPLASQNPSPPQHFASNYPAPLSSAPSTFVRDSAPPAPTENREDRPTKKRRVRSSNGQPPTDYQAAFDEVSAQLAEANDKKAPADKIKQLTAEKRRLRNCLSARNSREKKEQETTDLKTANSSLAAENAKLTLDIANLNNQIAELKTEITILNNKIAGLKAENGQLHVENARLHKQMSPFPQAPAPQSTVQCHQRIPHPCISNTATSIPDSTSIAMGDQSSQQFPSHTRMNFARASGPVIGFCCVLMVIFVFSFGRPFQNPHIGSGSSSDIFPPLIEPNNTGSLSDPITDDPSSFQCLLNTLTPTPPPTGDPNAPPALITNGNNNNIPETKELSIKQVTQSREIKVFQSPEHTVPHTTLSAGKNQSSSNKPVFQFLQSKNSTLDSKAVVVVGKIYTIDSPQNVTSDTPIFLFMDASGVISAHLNDNLATILQTSLLMKDLRVVRYDPHSDQHNPSGSESVQSISQ